MLLAIDTSTAVASVALYDGAVLAEHTWRAGQSHTTQLLPRIEALLAESGVEPAGLAAVCVALGPGSFNGLRVGLATAKLLSFSLGTALVGVDTLTATAYQHVESGGLIRPLYDAGRGQVATALFAVEDGGKEEMREVEPPRIANLGDLVAATSEPTLFCGELRPAWSEEISRGLGQLASFASPGAALRRAGYLAELGWRRWRAGQVANPTTLQPLYLRRPPVLERSAGAGSPATE